MEIWKSSDHPCGKAGVRNHTLGNCVADIRLYRPDESMWSQDADYMSLGHSIIQGMKAAFKADGTLMFPDDKIKIAEKMLLEGPADLRCEPYGNAVPSNLVSEK